MTKKPRRRWPLLFALPVDHFPFECSPIPFAPEYYVQEQFGRARRFPSWLVEWLDRWSCFSNWLHVIENEIIVKDYSHNRTLFTDRSIVQKKVVVTNRWMLLTSEEGDYFHIAIYALPFPSWSPWWARSAGIGVALLCCLAFSRSPLPTGPRGEVEKITTPPVV